MLSIRNTVGALLLALLTMLSLSASAQIGVIPGDSVDGWNLNSLFSPPTNTVQNFNFIDNNNSGTDAIFGSAHPWNFQNYDYVVGNDNGVHLTSGGSVYNDYWISGGNNGILISGSAGSV